MRTTKNEDKLLEMIRQHDGDFELTNEQLSERLHLQPKSVTVLIRSVTLCDLFDDHAALQPGLPHHTRSQHRNIARSFQPVCFFLLIKVCRHQQLGCHLRTQRIADDLTIAQPDDEHAFDRAFCRIHEQSEMVQQRIDQFRSLKPAPFTDT